MAGRAGAGGSMEWVDTLEARAIARDLVAAELPGRWRHVQGVAAAATRISEQLPVDREVVIAAAWLHDIGYASRLRDTGFHPLDGARYLRRAGWPDTVCCLVAHHTAASVEAAAWGLAKQLEAEFPAAGSLERDALWVADATTGPDGQHMTVDERIAEVATRYGADHRATSAMRSSRDELQAAARRVEQHREASARR